MKVHKALIFLFISILIEREILALELYLGPGISLYNQNSSDNIENIKRDVEIGSGIAFLPLETVEREVELGLLHAIPLTDVDWTRPLGIVSKRRRRFSPAARKFIELLKSDGKPMEYAEATPVKQVEATEHA